MKRIKLTRGKVATVDDDDYEWLQRFNWRAMPSNNNRSWAGSTWYAATGVKTQLMHRLIMKAPKGIQVDHKNGDGLDNRRENLRLANRSQQRANCGRSSQPTLTRFKGVSFHRRDKLWRARITKDGKAYSKYAKLEVDAAKLYNEMATQHFGEFAKLNAIPE